MIQHNSFENDVYEFILEKFLKGDYCVGQRVNIDELKEETGASATPILGALRRLVYGGLLESSSRNKGYFIPKFTKEDLYEVKVALHFMALAACVKICRMESVDNIVAKLQPLADATVKVSKGNDYLKYMEVDQQFHNEIVRSIDSSGRILSIYNNLSNQYNCIRRILQTELVKPMDIITPHLHQEYITAIKNQNIDRIYEIVMMELAEEF